MRTARACGSLTALAATALLVVVGPALGASRAPDLTVAGLKAARSSVTAGGRVTVSVTVRDAGRTRAHASRTALYLSRDAVHNAGDVRLATVRTRTLAAHRSQRRKVRIRIPSGTAAGTYRLVACADVAGRIREASERNNCGAARRAIRVLAGGATPGGPGTKGPVANPNGDDDGDGFRNAVDCGPNDPATHPGAPDAPDLAFKDTNCDGIDGDVTHAIFVSGVGSDANPGTRAEPKKTIGAGIKAASLAHKDVYVTRGDFPETLTLADGVSIYGGYSPGWSRARANTTRITGDATGSGKGTGINADNITVLTTLQLLTIAPTAPTRDSMTAYGLRGQNSFGLILDTLAIVAPKGVAGGVAQTLPAGTAGANGASGSSAGGGKGGASPGGEAGGGGGTGGIDGDPGAAGGAGLPTTPDAFGRFGGPGGPGGAVGHVGGAGNAGDFGVLGADGDGGAAGNAEPPFLGFWDSKTGLFGHSGTDGAGGGGGGGGGSEDCICLFPDDGGGGGGGGGGGRGGFGGVGGGGGGGSFGIFLAVSTGAVVRNSTVTAGDGGDGGNGGLGAAGGQGGQGGKGAVNGNGGHGGNGARGGNGGRGGDGGGGAGGPSVAIYGLLPTAVTGTTVKHGAGGAGGKRDPAALHGGGVGATGTSADFLQPS